MESCGALLGEWLGDWQYPKNNETVLVKFTFVKVKDNQFAGFYHFEEDKNNTFPFKGSCSINDEYISLTFKPASLPYDSEICIGTLNKQNSLWLGCPYLKQNGIFRSAAKS